MAVTPEKLGWTGLAVPGAYPGAVPVFEPPTVSRPMGPASNRLFNRMAYRSGVTVLKEAGSYRAVENPTDEEVAAADEVYTGGRSFVVYDIDEVAALEAAGYEVIGP